MQGELSSCWAELPRCGLLTCADGGVEGDNLRAIHSVPLLDGILKLPGSVLSEQWLVMAGDCLAALSIVQPATAADDD